MDTTDTHIHELTIPAYHTALLNGTTTCEKTVAAYLAQIDKHNPTLRAIITVNKDALNDAHQKDIERHQILQSNPPTQKNKASLPPLHGVPLLLKDTYTTSTLPTTAGSLSLRTLRTQNTNAPIIQSLLASGAIILAKTNLHEFSLEGTTTSSLGGQTLNPYDLRRTPGGSSGGTAAALAANMGLVGCGGDTMNSLRSPASACAVVGFRPTTGRVCTTGVVPVSRTQDALGPMGRSVGDVRVLWGVMKESTLPGGETGTSCHSPSTDTDTAATTAAAADTNTNTATSTTTPKPKPDAKEEEKEDRPLRIGILTTYFPDPNTSNPESLAINTIMQTALQKVQSSRPIQFIPLPPQPDWSIDHLRATADTQSFEFKEEIDSFLQSPFITHTPHRTLTSIAASDEYHPSAVTAAFHETLQTDKFNTKSEVYKTRLQRIQDLKASVQARFEQEKLDALVYPHQKNLVVPVGGTVQSGRNGILAALTGRPAVCIPAGFAQPPDQTPKMSGSDCGPGIPVGLELMGIPWLDDELLDIAEVFEGVIQGRRAPLLTSDYHVHI